MCVYVVPPGLMSSFVETSFDNWVIMTAGMCEAATAGLHLISHSQPFQSLGAQRVA